MILIMGTYTFSRAFRFSVSIAGCTKGGQQEGDDKTRRRSASMPLSRLPTTLEHLVAGTIGGMSGVLVSYPLDTVKVR